MTVWETDTMPTQWRNTLNHVLEVWLPCDFNVEAFRTQVRQPLAKIPHPLLPRNGHDPLPDPGDFLRISPEDFVVYSIFEWQERKCPLAQIKCFLQAFSPADRAVLILKTNPGAADVAQQALAEARQQVSSQARVELRCEAWDEAQIAALHQRGNCYLSLHRGEGWCYPLFEAACNGTPVVATAYSEREADRIANVDRMLCAGMCPGCAAYQGAECVIDNFERERKPCHYLTSSLIYHITTR